jgi:hypothetical protein
VEAERKFWSSDQMLISNFALVKHGWKIIPVLWLACAGSGCSVSEQTPGEVSQKFQQGIEGKGKLVPEEQPEQGVNPDSANSPAALPVGKTE